MAQDIHVTNILPRTPPKAQYSFQGNQYYLMILYISVS